MAISFACFGPVSQGSSMTTMPAPNLTSGSPKTALSPATVMSQASAISQPPASAGPRTAATVGLDSRQNRMTPSKSRRSTGRHSSWPCGVFAAWSCRSKPDENALPAPVTTRARMASSASMSSQADWISDSICWLIAFSRSGLFSVRTATGPSLVSMMVWYGIVTPPRPDRRCARLLRRGAVERPEHDPERAGHGAVNNRTAAAGPLSGGTWAALGQFGGIDHM